MTLIETYDWMVVNAKHISWLANQGDKLALRLYEAYKALHGNRLDPYLQSEYMKVCDDFCRRDLTLTTRTILMSRYGYKLPPEMRLDG